MVSIFWYYANGKLRSQDSTIFGTYEGSYVENYPNGQPLKRCYYYQGNMHGLCREYNEQGILTVESNYYNGMLNGTATYFSDGGQVAETRYYFYDQLLSVKN